MADIAKASRLISWLKDNGGHFHPSADLKIDADTGLSPFSTSSIGPDERLVSCPFDLAITSNIATRAIYQIKDITESDLVWPAGTSKQGEKWNERMRIAAYLGLHWIYQDKPNETWPTALSHLIYLDSLPQPSSLTTPLYFSPCELELLKGSTLHGAVEARKNEWKAECEVVRGAIREDGLTWDRYLVISTYMSSRSFPSKLLRIPEQGGSTSQIAKKDDESQPVLLPGLDLFNHSRGQPIVWLSSLTPTSTGQTTPSVSLVSTQSTQSGSQLYNNYGPKSNEELLLGYGFVIPSNPDDVVTLKLGTSGLPPHTQTRLQVKGLDADQTFELRRDGEMDKSLLEVVRIMLNDNEHDHDHDHDKGIDEDDDHAQHQHEEKEMQLELDVLGMLGGMLDDKLEKLQTSSEEDENSDIREEVRRMCDIYKQGQIDILNSAMDKLSERIERIEGLLDEGMGGCPCGC
ncbi:uncharacterized protein IL334_000895 [Kwoniella shivajii]|uniref:Rubisco LSMT substrate-binding domain-containing protein n=1 Tax=Kwoniella shivajii TaxID=564305 RepID=A0ABZ1CQF6_9TREE|nr:hypothetical protein IL334_000895 [Kwoniella shivajii]